MTWAAQKGIFISGIVNLTIRSWIPTEPVACALAVNRNVSGVSDVEAFLFIAGQLRTLLHSHGSVAAPELDGWGLKAIKE